MDKYFLSPNVCCIVFLGFKGNRVHYGKHIIILLGGETTGRFGTWRAQEID